MPHKYIYYHTAHAIPSLFGCGKLLQSKHAKKPAPTQQTTEENAAKLESPQWALFD
jgi:hypothetical protein